ncbi:MAG: hypothetical protein FJ404_19195 [Verrucomicrobia bacterium]|nr:hypothetical protein [Verrucomicrobiota bacterium]
MTPLDPRILSTLLESGLPHLDLTPRAGTWTEAQSESFAKELGSGQPMKGNPGLIAGIVLAWHDHFEAAHALAQECDTPLGAWLHALLHRREPDYSNSKYWLRRAGRLPEQAMAWIPFRGEPKTSTPAWLEVFPAPMARAMDWDTMGACFSHGCWNPSGFVDTCARALIRKDPEVLDLLERFQALEFYCLISTAMEAA